MATDMFLKIDGIPGESTDAGHPGEIAVASYSFGLSNSGGDVGGEASFQDFHFVSQLQKSSPKLFLACASGQHIKSAILSVRRTNNGFPDYYKVKLSDVMVTSFEEGGTADSQESVPLEQISLNFAKIEIDYSVQDAKGVLGETIQVIWDLTQ
jgi:type VI secretion system secreted protein Hcp